MRVIAGLAKGRRLVAPKGEKTRPTADRVKESLFGIIADRIEGATVLDLFAGSGALGIEALSRGAASAVFVDPDRAAVGAVKRNLESTGFTEKATVYQAPAVRALDLFCQGPPAFNLIFLDPPYKIEPAELEVVMVKVARCCGDGGLVVLEHRPDLPDLRQSERLVLVDRRRYGDTGLRLFEKREP